jgi:hypothetical protein
MTECFTRKEAMMTTHDWNIRQGRSAGRGTFLAAVGLGLLWIPFGIVLPSEVGAVPVPLIINTSALAGQDARLEFDLFDGDLSPGNNSVTIFNISTDGTLGSAICDPGLGCSGGPPFAITDAASFGQLLQDLTLGNTLSFTLDLTTNFSGVAGAAPDRFFLNLLDPDSNFTLIDTNLDRLSDAVPVQDALIFIDLVGGARGHDISLATSTGPSVPIGIVPEPGALSLMILGLPLLWALARRPAQGFST